MKTSFEKFMASSAVQPIKVEMALVDDIEKILDTAIAKKRVLTEQAKKVSKELNDLQSSFATAFMMAKKASESAKQLGATDLVKLFESRAAEAKDFEGAVGGAANKIFASVSSI
jgi:hypothetical protein